MGAKLQSHIPAQVNMGYIFRKKKYGSIAPKIREKVLFFKNNL